MNRLKRITVYCCESFKISIVLNKLEKVRNLSWSRTERWDARLQDKSARQDAPSQWWKPRLAWT